MTYTYDGHIGKKTEVIVEYEYEPGQKLILHPVDEAQPGFAARVTVLAVLLLGDNILDDLSEEYFDRLESEILREKE